MLKSDEKCYKNDQSLATRNKGCDSRNFVTIIPPHLPIKVPDFLDISAHYGNIASELVGENRIETNRFERDITSHNRTQNTEPSTQKRDINGD